VSPEARAFLATLKDPHLMPAFPDPTDIAGWTKVQAAAEADALRAKFELNLAFRRSVLAWLDKEVPA